MCSALAARGIVAWPRVAQTGRPLTLIAGDLEVSHSAAFRHRTLVTAGDFCWNRHLLFDLVLAFTHDAS